MISSFVGLAMYRITTTWATNDENNTPTTRTRRRKCNEERPTTLAALVLRGLHFMPMGRKKKPPTQCSGIVRQLIISAPDGNNSIYRNHYEGQAPTAGARSAFCPTPGQMKTDTPSLPRPTGLARPYHGTAGATLPMPMRARRRGQGNDYPGDAGADLCTPRA